MKRLIAFFLTLATIFCLVACSKNSVSDSVNSDGAIVDILMNDGIISSVNEDGTSRLIFGNLAEMGKIDNAQDATQLVRHYAGQLGVANFSEDYELADAVNYGDGVTYRYSQKYNDVPVVGGEIRITTDENGNPIGIINNNVNIPADFDMTITVSAEDASSAATGYLFEKAGCVYSKREDISNVIFVPEEGVPFYAWLFEYSTKTAATYSVIVDAKDVNKIVYSTNEYDAVVTGKNSFGEVKSFEVPEQNGTYYLYDSDHHISIYDYQNENNLITSQTSEWSDETEVDLMTNFITIQNYVKDKLGLNSIDNKGLMIRCVDNYEKDKKTNASWLGFGTKEDGTHFGEIAFSYNPNGELPFTMCLDVCAHEYGHGLVNYYLAGYKKIPAYWITLRSFDEAYADIFACCVDGNWTILEDYYPLVSSSKKYARSIETPDTEDGYKTKMPTSTLWASWYTNSTILSHCAYNMSTKYNISTDDLALIWINSLRFLNTSSNFQDVRDAVVISAIQLSKLSGKINLSDKQIDGIISIFEEAGLTGNEFEELDIVKATVNEETPGQAIIDVKIEDALNYSKAVVVYPPLADFWSADGMTHDIRIPKLSSETSNAKAFNQKLYDVSGKAYETLRNNQEENQLYSSDYKYKEHNGVFGIVIESIVGAQAAGASRHYDAFYYDANQDKELTFNEYLETLGLSYDLLTSKVKNTSQYNEYYTYISDYNDVYVKDCILNSNGSIVYLNDIEIMWGWNCLEVESLLQ